MQFRVAGCFTFTSVDHAPGPRSVTSHLSPGKIFSDYRKYLNSFWPIPVDSALDFKYDHIMFRASSIPAIIPAIAVSVQIEPAYNCDGCKCNQPLFDAEGNLHVVGPHCHLIERGGDGVRYYAIALSS